MFGPNAPPKNLQFPPSANITAVELLTFLPYSLKAHDVVNRLVSNGFSRSVICVIVNRNRDIGKEWTADSTGKLLSETMRTAGYQGWTIRKHKKWFKDVAEVWDENNIKIAGPDTQGAGARKSNAASSISFERLAKGVRAFPAGHDALDLTRMVKHAVDNPQETWTYPEDYGKLLSMIGGPLEVRQGHTDLSAFKRWENSTPRLQQGLPNPSPAATNRGTPATPQHRTTLISDAPTAYPQKRRGRLPKDSGYRVDTKDRKSGGTIRKGDKTKDARIFQLYIRGPPKFVQPPRADYIGIDDEVENVFQASASTHGMDSFNAYAFATLRHVPPYRQLHRVGPPVPSDSSWWAENLRWAAEQRSLFVGATGWNDSRVHMRLITQARIQQEWLSDEWLNNCFKKEERMEKMKQMSATRRVKKEHVRMQPVQSDRAKVEQYFRVMGVPMPAPGDDTFFDDPTSLVQLQCEVVLPMELTDGAKELE